MDQQGAPRGGPMDSLFDSLPEALLTNILNRDVSFRRLCQLRTVSKTFCSAISQVDHASCSLEKANSIPGLRLVQFIRGNDRLTSLSLCCSSLVSLIDGSMLLSALLGAARSLRSFKLSEGSMRYTGSEELAHQLFGTLSYLPQLELLSIISCKIVVHGRLPSEHQLKRLLTLDLCWASLTDSGLASLLKACPSLQHLKLHDISGLERPRIDCCTLLSLVWGEMERGSYDVMDIRTPLLQSLSVPKITKANIYAPNIVSFTTDFLGRLVGPPFLKLRKVELWGCDWTVDQFVEVLSVCRTAKVVKLGIFFWEPEARQVPLSEMLSPLDLRNVQELSMSRAMIDMCIIQPETKPAPFLWQGLKKLNLEFDSSDSKLILALQLVRISPGLKELVIDLGQATGAVPIEEVAVLLKIQQHNPKLDLRVKS